MSQRGLTALDSSVQDMHGWLQELMDELGWQDRQNAYRALREGLHDLRDRLPVDAVTTLGSQLPLLLRGVYYEDWRPTGQPRPHAGARPGDLPAAVSAILRVLQRRVPLWPYPLVVLSGRAEQRALSRGAG